MKNNFEQLANLKANNKIPVVKYKSLRTGLTVTVAQVRKIFNQICLMSQNNSIKKVLIE